MVPPRRTSPARAVRQRWLGAVAFAVAAACAAPPSESLTDGRGLSPGSTTGPSTPTGGDAGIQLPTTGGSTPAPTITAMDPPNALVGSVPPTLSITGQNFTTSTVIEMDGKAMTTTFASDTSISTTLPATLFTQTGTHEVTIYTPPPGGGRTSPIAFSVTNPVATLAALTPDAVLVGANDTKVTITGTGFVPGSTALFGATVVPTTFVNSTELTAILLQTSLATSGSVPIIVSNPLPGGGSSSRIAFTIANPTVTVTAVTPSTAIVGASDTSIALTGTGFVSGSAVSFNGTAIRTTVTSNTALTATVPAASLTTTGAFPVAVTNPAPGGGVSLPVTFTVGNPEPTITTLTPPSAIAGSPPVLVRIDGTGFVSASQVIFGGAPSATTYVSATEVTATLTTSELATAGTIAVTVVNPTPGGGASTPATFTVESPPAPDAGDDAGAVDDAGAGDDADAM
jgi:hypothetical protein